MYVKQREDQFMTHGDTHDYKTRHRSDLVMSHCRLSRCQNRPEFIAVKLFNKIPLNMRALPVMQFKQKIKKVLCNNAFYSVQEYLDCNTDVHM